MPFNHALLEKSELGPMVAKMVASSSPAPMRKMAAQGLAPLPPRDLLVALYQLWVEPNGDCVDLANATVEKLPDTIINGALSDSKLPAGVLDLLGRKLMNNASLLEAVVRHPNTSDESTIGIARACSESICELIAANQQRWMACPGIVASLYHNRNCRQSVIHRVLEMATREGLDIKLPFMDEIREALTEDSADDSRDNLFSKSIKAETEDPEIGFVEDIDQEGGPESQHSAQHDVAKKSAANLGSEGVSDCESSTRSISSSDMASEKELSDETEDIGEEPAASLRSLKPMEKIRAALLGNKSDRAVLIRDTNKMVAMATIKSPRVREDEAIIYAADRSLSHDVIRYIANKRDWLKYYTIKFNLVMNPKTPMSRSLSLLGFLSQRDIQKVARSKNIPSALAKAAKRKASGAA